MGKSSIKMGGYKLMCVSLNMSGKINAERKGYYKDRTYQSIGTV